MTFRLAPTSAGANPLYWDSIQDLLGEADVPIAPSDSYSPYVELVTLGNGQRRGLGLPFAIWIMSVTPIQKYILRQICPSESSNVYIETQTNDYDVSGNRIWTQAAAIMEWHEGEESIEGDIVTTDLTFRFSHLVEVS